MAIKIRYLLTAFLLALAAVSCTREPATGPDEDFTGVKLRLLINTPGASATGTRAVAEEEVSEISVLVFENSGSGYVYRYIVGGYSLTAGSSSDNYDYEFLARLQPSANPLRLYLVANASDALNGLTAGMTEDQVKEAVVMAYTSAGFDDVLPMSGVVDLSALTADTTVDDAVLVRSVAKVDIYNSATNFTLTSVKVYRATDEIQVIPDELTDNSVSTASVPAGAGTVDTGTYAVTGTSLTDQIYIPESAIPDAADRRLGATSVVVGGLYDGSSVTTYYRMDFIPDDDSGDPDDALFGQVLRNHLYRFNISGVLAPGWSTDDEAAVNPSTGIEVEIQVWDEVTLDMVFDDYDYFGVTRRSVRLGYAAGSEDSIGVDTSLDTYRAYWGDEDGNITDESTYITLGEDFDDPDGLFNVAISSDGTEITFTALAAYDAATAETEYLVIAAGRLRIVLSVSQGPASYGNGAVSVFNSTLDIGTLGNFVTGSGWNPTPGERAQGLGYMLVGTLAYGPQNFGPGKTVDMNGIYITGLSLDNTMPRNYYQGSDVLYLTYGRYPTAAQAESILEWLEEDEHRVLIVQFDNTAANNTSGTNYTVMALLGLNRVPETAVVDYTFAGTDAPDFIRYGPFGTLPDTFDYNCRDDTYGGIDPTAAAAAGFQPLLLTGNGGNYALMVDPDRRIILCGDCDIYSNVNAGSGGYLLDIDTSSAAALTIDPANPAEVMMGNLWAWIVDVVLRED
ncbi:MAG: hypothetical protein LUF87_05030 [Alistipes sp.]|nr:hypothetical protein [Alistipes sp.]